MKLHKYFFLLFLFLIGCRNSSIESVVPINLPEFNADIISDTNEFVFISVNPSFSKYVIIFKGEVNEVDSLGYSDNWKKYSKHPVLFVIDKNTKMSILFELEYQIGRCGVDYVYYVSKPNFTLKETVLHGISRILPATNQSGTYYRNRLPLPPMPSINYMISKFPFQLFEIKKNAILANGNKIELEEVESLIQNGVANDSGFFVCYHLDSNATYELFTRYLCKENETYALIRNQLSLSLYGKLFNELEENEKVIIQRKIPIQSMRINDVDLERIKTNTLEEFKIAM